MLWSESHCLLLFLLCYVVCSVLTQLCIVQIFSMSMWNYGPDVMDALVELITSLVCDLCLCEPWCLEVLLLLSHFFMLQAASSGKYVDACLYMLVSNFSPPFRFIESLKLPYGKAKKEQVLDRVHFALECITDLIPLAPSRLLPIVMHRIHAIYQRTPEPVSSGPHLLFESGYLWLNLL